MRSSYHIVEQYPMVYGPPEAIGAHDSESPSRATVHPHLPPRWQIVLTGPLNGLSTLVLCGRVGWGVGGVSGLYHAVVLVLNDKPLLS